MAEGRMTLAGLGDVSDALGLTKRQSEALHFIQVYITERAYSPSYREIKAALNLSSISRVYELVEALEERGHIIKAPGLARSIQLRSAQA